MLEKSTFVTDAEAEREYNDQNSVAEIKYVHVPYYAINDSSVSVTDADLIAYIKSNSEDYQVDWSRSIEYVTFPIIPSLVRIILLCEIWQNPVLVLNVFSFSIIHLYKPKIYPFHYFHMMIQFQICVRRQTKLPPLVSELEI